MILEKALYLIPVTLGETEIRSVLPDYNHDVIVQIKHFIVENIRSARRFLKKVEKTIDIAENFDKKARNYFSSINNFINQFSDLLCHKENKQGPHHLILQQYIHR